MQDAIMKSVRKANQFSRNAGAESADANCRMPSNTLDANVANVTIGELLGRLEDFTSGLAGGPEMYPWASRFVMGLPLPSWQRGHTWSREQDIRFIQSIWAGVDIGTYMVNDLCSAVPGVNGKHEHYRENSDILLDGQQRLTALQSYVLNEFPISDVTGKPRFWQDLPLIERRRFSGTHFARASVRSWDEVELRRAYDLRAFGGTAHTEEERALPSEPKSQRPRM